MTVSDIEYQQEVENNTYIMDYLRKKSVDFNQKIAQDLWTPIQYASSIGDDSCIRFLLSHHAITNMNSSSKVLPMVTPLMIAVKYGHIDIVKLLLEHIDVNVQDQFGFTAIHYATISNSKTMIQLLLGQQNVSVMIPSKNGTTPYELAVSLKFDDIAALLQTKMQWEQDDTLPMFRDWLTVLGGSEYFYKFIEAGYKLPFIAEYGLTDADMDCVGIPQSKLGLRRQLIALYRISEFYVNEDEGNEEEEEEDEEGDDEEGEDIEEEDE